MSTNGHITLWKTHPNRMKTNVPNMPPDPVVKAPLLAVFWANSTTVLKSGRREKKLGMVHARVYYRIRKHKAVMSSLNRKITWLLNLKKYNGKWALIVQWDVTYAGAWTKTPVRITSCVYDNNGLLHYISVSPE